MKIFTLIALFATLSLVYSQNKAVVCYYPGGWSSVAPDPTICTHMMFAFVDVQANGTISDSKTANFATFLKLKSQNPNIKLLVSVGGAGLSSNLTTILGNSKLQENFVSEAKRVIADNKLDGIDIDYEPNGGEKVPLSSYTQLITAVKKALPAGKLLTIAVFPDQTRVDAIYEPLKLSNQVDFINLMTYDFHGAWGTGDEKVTYYQSPLRQGSLDSSVFWKTLNGEACLNYWVSKQVPKNKLMLGVPLYGKTYTLADANNNGVGAPFLKPGNPVDLFYSQICSNIKSNGWTEKYYSDQDFHYAFKGNQWVSYDNIDTVGRKAQYVKDNNYGGIMFWSTEKDDWSGALGNGKYPLIRKAFSVLVQNGASPTAAPTVAPTAAPTVAPTTTTKSPVTPPATPPASGNLCIGSKAGLFAFSGDCNKFYNCDGKGGGGVLSCPVLGFNPKTSSCDLKTTVIQFALQTHSEN